MINLYGLKYFYDACRMNSMAEAAEHNHVSPPAISQAIKKLETELNLKLLDHKRRELRPTRDGLLLMKRAALILDQVRSITSDSKDTSSGLLGTLTVGSARSLVTSFLDDAISKLKERHPQLDIKLQIGNSEDLVRLLNDRKIDVAIYLGDERLAGQTQIVIGRGHFQFLVPTNKKVKAFAITDKRPETDRLKILYKKEFKKELPIFCTVPSWDAIQSWIDRGICGGLIPEFMVDNLKSNNRILIEKVFPYEIKVVHLDSRVDDSLVQGFISCLKP